MRTQRSLPPAAAAAALLLVASVSLAAPEDPAPRIDREPGPAVSEPVESLQAPAVEATGAPLPRLTPITLRSVTIPVDPRYHRGGLLTDSDPATAAPLTANERAKLEMARAAVEASRAAGTLLVVPQEEEDLLSPAEREAVKQQRWTHTPPAELPPDVAAGTAEVEPVQEIGPSGLSEYERQKRQGLNPAPLTAPEIAETPAPNTGDGAPATTREEGRTND
jgi:hypothetical protein